jgi:hypothetical protein
MRQRAARAAAPCSTAASFNGGVLRPARIRESRMAVQRRRADSKPTESEKFCVSANDHVLEAARPARRAGRPSLVRGWRNRNMGSRARTRATGRFHVGAKREDGERDTESGPRRKRRGRQSATRGVKDKRAHAISLRGLGGVNRAVCGGDEIGRIRRISIRTFTFLPRTVSHRMMRSWACPW